MYAALDLTPRTGTCRFSLLNDDDLEASAEFEGGEYITDSLEVESRVDHSGLKTTIHAVDWDCLNTLYTTCPAHFCDTQDGKAVPTKLVDVLIRMCAEDAQ